MRFSTAKQSIKQYLRKAIIVQLITLPTYALDYPYHVDSSRVQVINSHDVTTYENYEKNVQIIWDVVKNLLKVEANQFQQAPVIVLEEFDQDQNRSKWTQFQKEWFETYSFEEPFNAKRLPAYFYKKTPFIQLRPSYFNEEIPLSRLGPLVKDALQAYYTAGHEFMHYALEVLGVDLAVHHCLMITRAEGQTKTLGQKLLRELRSLGLAVKNTNAIYKMEVQGLPCRRLAPKQKQEVQNFLNSILES